ncbi:M23 family metallopeptidase [Salipaludibacillus daqingensis]|uniref:M23 family metallopeptidase n=1 Tax=Salipaludibacillus daqingensis TaxID=3041001 RepID=UPI0024768280|nr:M23 family metallopeptidase [Salipaludibacillus daqingensis]
MNNHEENKASKWEQLKANTKRLMKKRWAMPALYLGLSAIVLTTFLWMSATDEDLADLERDSEFDIEGLDEENAENPFGEENGDEEAVPAVSHDEVFDMPVVDDEEVAVVGTFHDYEASVEEQKQSLIHYDNYYYQNKGIDLAKEDESTFDVTATLSGTVVKAEEDPLFGQVIHIEHDEDTLTIYQSLENVTVETGQSVRQGDVLGQAGRNLYNRDAGVHAHFEIRKAGVPVNPLDFMDKQLSDLPDFSEEEQEEQQAPEQMPDPEEDFSDSSEGSNNDSNENEQEDSNENDENDSDE